MGIVTNQESLNYKRNIKIHEYMSCFYIYVINVIKLQPTRALEVEGVAWVVNDTCRTVFKMRAEKAQRREISF